MNQDLDVGLAVEYFVQAWTFSGLVRPLYVWFAGNGVFAVAVITLILCRMRAKNRNGGNI